MDAKNKKQKTHTLILSDLHLGTDVSQPEKALAVLKSYSFRKLILLGDIFDSLDFRNLSRPSWDFIAYVGKISPGRKVRWVIGNHDQELTDFFASFMSAETYEMYTWRYREKKYLAIHGHQFDRFLINNAFLSYLATRVYNFIQKFDSQEKIVSHYLKRKSKGWLRLSEKVARSALRFGRQNDANYVFCGHTHKSLEKNSHGIHYYNSGCFCDNPCSYITIDENNIRVHEL